MKKLVVIVGISIDAQNAVLYLKNGETLTIPQGDSRLPEIVRIAKQELPVRKEATVNVAEPVEVRDEFRAAEEGTKGLVKFFRVAKKFVKKFLDTESPETVPAEVAHISPLELGIKPGEQLSEIIGDSIDEDVPAEAEPSNSEKLAVAKDRLNELMGAGKTVSDPEFHKPIKDSDNDTIIAVNTETGSVIPNAHKLASQLRSAQSLKDYQGFTNFIKRLELVIHDRGHSVEDLMKFIEKGDLPIADDGCIVIYKRLQKMGDSFVDVHSKKIKQDVGSYVFMKPGLVDPNRRQDCSNGLHVASLGYLSSFSGNVTVMAKVRPEDVFAVPEYSVTKMRVCGYHILAVLPDSLRNQVNSGKSISEIPEGKELLNKVLRGVHVGVTQLVEVGGHEGTNVTYTDVAPNSDVPLPDLSLTEVSKNKTLEEVDLSKDTAKAMKAAPVSVEDLKPVDKTPPAPVTEPVKPEGKKMSTKEQAAELYRVFKETKAKGNRANTKDAAQELQYFFTSRKKGPKAFGLDPKVSEELKTWLK